MPCPCRKSRTFHGRDVFAPVAAHLSRGVPISKLGPALKDHIKVYKEPAKMDQLLSWQKPVPVG